jgi:hypothetical protein
MGKIALLIVSILVVAIILFMPLQHDNTPSLVIVQSAKTPLTKSITLPQKANAECRLTTIETTNADGGITSQKVRICE